MWYLYYTKTMQYSCILLLCFNLMYMWYYTTLQFTLNYIHLMFMYNDRPHPVNVGIQYEPRVMSDEDAKKIMDGNDLEEFMKAAAPR